MYLIAFSLIINLPIHFKTPQSHTYSNFFSFPVAHDLQVSVLILNLTRNFVCTLFQVLQTFYVITSCDLYTWFFSVHAEHSLIWFNLMLFYRLTILQLSYFSLIFYVNSYLIININKIKLDKSPGLFQLI